MNKEITCQTLLDDKTHRLGLEVLGGMGGLKNPLRSPRIQKPGLALAGYFKQIRPNRVQILGATELRYLESISPEAKTEAIKNIFALDIACFIVTKGQAVDPLFIEEAERRQIPLFRTMLTSRLLIERVEKFLEDRLAPTTHMHGVLVQVLGIGVLIRGPSGIGKSECAMDLILRGHKLVADDIVQMRLLPPFKLVGRGAGIIRYHMEIRGLGILNIKDLFGVTSICDEHEIDLVIDLIPWAESQDHDRLGMDDKVFSILTVEVPHLRIPVAAGRNMASVIEVAARNHLLKKMGVNSAVKFAETLESKLKEGKN